MKANDFVKEFGLEKAEEVLSRVPDETATHYVLDTDTYFSEEFLTYFDHSSMDWETADLHCVSDLYGNYECVLDIQELKTVVEAWDLVDSFNGVEQAQRFNDENLPCEDSIRLEQAIKLVQS